MAHFLGIDLGTSSVKVVVTAEHGQIVGLGAQSYPIHTRQPGWAEQTPDQWWWAMVTATRQALAQSDYPEIAGIGLSGQMHGTVLLDAQNEPLGDAIIWADQRSMTEARELGTLLNKLNLAHSVGTTPATGFMATTLLWLQKHDPARLDKAKYSLLPKDYIRLRLTGEVCTDVTDASATLLFDVGKRIWCVPLLDAMNLRTGLFPAVMPSEAVVGHLTRTVADLLGLRAGIPVVAGCADQPAQALGNGLIDPGIGSITVGSGGQVFIPIAAPLIDPKQQLHVFCHAPADRWYAMGTMLSAGLSFRWLRDLLGWQDDPQAYPKLSALAGKVAPGAEGLCFLPYLSGERASNTPLIPGAFVGLTLQHQTGHLARAIMEGVAFVLRDIADTMRALENPASAWVVSGGGLADPTWRQIVADVLNTPLLFSDEGEKAAVGAAMLAAIGVGSYSSYREMAEALQNTRFPTIPNPETAGFYRSSYQMFLKLRQHLAEI